ncbi:MAG TPA: primase-like DNA-binding domain-containing protein [Pirellulaceae bacterium]|nr:primase-like DNA-binding domain-containing protein [Pirellulaceae bacterium]
MREKCVVEPAHRIDVDKLYAAWKHWCERDGRTNATTKQRFGKDLAAAVPGVARRRGSGNVSFYAGICLREDA